ncbi:glycerate kinase type-2 family protein [Niveispirillum sp. KHB5.9]|uniref:glycerate kinase type-2 family protein n=1 Tax=Niveispirillum sp. KHB5.9 TaxID=3400269 RepID=UPI003A846D1D
MHQRELLRGMFDAAVGSALPHRCVPPHLPAPPKGRTIVVGAGKAAASMAQAVERHWQGDIEGVVVTRYGHAVPCGRIRVLEAAHPVPDQAGVAAARAILDTVSGLTAEDLVLCLISGGGSALLPALPDGVSLADEQALARALLRSGATIAEMNRVRRHVSLIKGGRLAAAASPARVETLIISDVPGDDPAIVASGPTVVDGSTPQDALAIIAKYGLEVPAGVQSWLEGPGCAPPTNLPNSRVTMVATAQMALEAAADVAARAGCTPLILGNAIEGEAGTVGLVHAGIVRQIRGHGQPVKCPCVLLSGGETTVTVRGNGRGGRNGEFLLGLLAGLGDMTGVSALAADTDGIDGTQDNAGAIIDAGTMARAGRLKPDACLRANDAYGFFQATGDLLVTGPTLTNVNDFRAILIEEPEAR